MIKVESQLHGYSHGHELLSATVLLEKGDQTVIDRLSDVAGPLRSGETFEPYLSTYPLPSGRWTVLARTWPDDTVSRSGCVRTLSLLIPTEMWAHSRSIWPFVALLDQPGLPSHAQPVTIPVPQATPLPPAQMFGASELLEALFLEEQRPIAIFDAPQPELIATRLLTALWPSIRRQFALSTLALSPRRIEGRDFNLVFAPKSARQKFSEWSGRRVDGQANASARHRWTNSIVGRVFSAPIPRLVEDSDLHGTNQEEDSTGALLRISLLWDELLAKLEHSPSAALGLLDIAKTRPELSPHATATLRRVLSSAAQRATNELPTQDAWTFIGAMARKLHGSSFAKEMHWVQSSVEILARKDPAGALRLLALDDPTDVMLTLVAPIAEGLAGGIASGAQVLPWYSFASLPSVRVVQLLEKSPTLARIVALSPGMLDEVAAYAAALPFELFDGIRDALLPHLIDDFQIVLASQFIASLDGDGLVQTTQRLIAANDFAAASFINPLVARARTVHALYELRAALQLMKDNARHRMLLRVSLEPSEEDVQWLLGNTSLTAGASQDLLIELLEAADDRQFHMLFSAGVLADAILHRVPASAGGVLRRVLLAGELPLDQHVMTTQRVLATCVYEDRTEIAVKALERCLRDHFSGDEVVIVTSLLNVVGPVLNPVWAISRGFEGRLESSLIRRNLLAFEKTEASVQSLILNSLAMLTRALEDRRSLDLDEAAAQACANLFWRAAQQKSPELLPAAAQMVRLLLRSEGWPVSAIVPATFPVVYGELAARDDAPVMLNFISFFDWDKCRVARTELIDAFKFSVWNIADLALTICLCPHEDRFLQRVVNGYRGNEFLKRFESSLEHLPQACRERLEIAVHETRAKR
ncbi:hypothetical protein ACJJWD_00030 [Comamonas testosteroni]|uniref:GAP1-N1 domain-containing protein n=1 Tax=Comamonas testosteroni TaxID=285 RepID=UPI0038999816